MREELGAEVPHRIKRARLSKTPPNSTGGSETTALKEIVASSVSQDTPTQDHSTLQSNAGIATNG